MQSLHSAITPAHLPFLARSPPWSPLLHLPCTRPSTTPPILQLSDFPTSRKAEKPTNRKVGKLASWHPLPGGGAPPRLTRPRRPTFRPCARYRSHFITPAHSFLLPPGKPPLPLPHLILLTCARRPFLRARRVLAVLPRGKPRNHLLHPLHPLRSPRSLTPG